MHGAVSQLWIQLHTARLIKTQMSATKFTESLLFSTFSICRSVANQSVNNVSTAQHLPRQAMNSQFSNYVHCIRNGYVENLLEHHSVQIQSNVLLRSISLGNDDNGDGDDDGGNGSGVTRHTVVLYKYVLMTNAFMYYCKSVFVHTLETKRWIYFCES